jgi:hypothetical protein
MKITIHTYVAGIVQARAAMEVLIIGRKSSQLCALGPFPSHLQILHTHTHYPTFSSSFASYLVDKLREMVSVSERNPDDNDI